MSSDSFSDERIVDSWRANAEPWTTAVRRNQIESRALVTNGAIVEAVVSRSPSSALDIGCGEGWLIRALAAYGIRSIGVDVVPALIDKARQAGGGEFRVASYEDLAAGAIELKVDAAIANFSLIGKESVEGLLSHVPALLNPGGALIVQTLHPVAACGERPYEDGWRVGSWAGFGGAFSDPAPWYFRTVEGWKKLITDSGLHLVEMREPLHPKTGLPASLILVATGS